MQKMNDAINLDGVDEPEAGGDPPNKTGFDRDIGSNQKARLVIDQGDLPRTAREIRALLIGGSDFFDRSGPARLVRNTLDQTLAIKPLDANDITIAVHEVAKVYKRAGKNLVRTTLPERVAKLYLSLPESCGLPVLEGISLAPTLRRCGAIQGEQGYDPKTGVWFDCNLDLAVPPMVSMAMAAEALLRLRQTFRTFAFADSVRVIDPATDLSVVDMTKPPGFDEATFLNALLTAVCRPSLPYSPGFLFSAPQLSGAGTGKGKLVRAMTWIAYGINPQPFPAGHDLAELDKRIATALMEACPVLFLDNLNGAELKSDTLASAITERPVRLRTLGSSSTRLVNSNCLVVVAGNGTTMAEDLVRRILRIGLDAKSESPEDRKFPTDFLEEMRNRREDLLTDLLMIWRAGRQNQDALQHGKPLGSFEQWCDWVRDPLLTLGVPDPVVRVAEMKARDPARLNATEIFETWHRNHGDNPVKQTDLSQEVLDVLNPHNRSRQAVSAELHKLVNVRVSGMTLTEWKGAGQWSKKTYRLERFQGD